MIFFLKNLYVNTPNPNKPTNSRKTIRVNIVWLSPFDTKTLPKGSNPKTGLHNTSGTRNSAIKIINHIFCFFVINNDALIFFCCEFSHSPHPPIEQLQSFGVTVSRCDGDGVLKQSGHGIAVDLLVFLIYDPVIDSIRDYPFRIVV